MKNYSVRKMGTKLGKPHYGSECNVCHRVIIVAHVNKEVATGSVKDHLKEVHKL